jgi:hypothetical protein
MRPAGFERAPTRFPAICIFADRLSRYAGGGLVWPASTLVLTVLPS